MLQDIRLQQLQFTQENTKSLNSPSQTVIKDQYQQHLVCDLTNMLPEPT